MVRILMETALRREAGRERLNRDEDLHLKSIETRDRSRAALKGPNQGLLITIFLRHRILNRV